MTYRSKTKGKPHAWVQGYVDAGDTIARHGYLAAMNARAIQMAMLGYAENHGFAAAQQYEKGWKAAAR